MSVTALKNFLWSKGTDLEISIVEEDCIQDYLSLPDAVLVVKNKLEEAKECTADADQSGTSTCTSTLTASSNNSKVDDWMTENLSANIVPNENILLMKFDNEGFLILSSDPNSN